jgi:peptidoglycan hydrolase-like protein with peptidoglycan-binding domain
MARQELVRVLRAVFALAAMAVLIVPATAEASYATRTLKQGSQGSDVKQLQKYLKKVGFKTTVDGYYGGKTATAEKSFEEQSGRKVDGAADKRDQKLVRKAAKTGVMDAAGNGGSGMETPPTTPPSSNPTERATLSSDGRTAIAPDSAPQEVKDAIAAANKITTKPYRYGGGHGKWEDSGYDCSGSVSYALHGGGLLKRPLDSSSFMSWGAAGKGQWITVYANSGHAYTIIAGLRFDTSAAGASGGSGPRWRNKWRSPSGYTARHPSGF